MVGEKAADIIKKHWGQTITPFVRPESSNQKIKKNYD